MAAIGRAGDHQVVEDAAVLVEEQRVALLAGLQVEDVGRDQRLERAAAVGLVVAGAATRNAWPMCETSNRPACSRVQQVLGQDAGRVLHRHRVAGERHHAGAERDVLGR